jgi:hypothetical protein
MKSRYPSPLPPLTHPLPSGANARVLMGENPPLMLPSSVSSTRWKILLSNFPDRELVVVTSDAAWPPPTITWGCGDSLLAGGGGYVVHEGGEGGGVEGPVAFVGFDRLEGEGVVQLGGGGGGGETL